MKQGVLRAQGTPIGQGKLAQEEGSSGRSCPSLGSRCRAGTDGETGEGEVGAGGEAATGGETVAGGETGAGGKAGTDGDAGTDGKTVAGGEAGAGGEAVLREGESHGVPASRRV